MQTVSFTTVKGIHITEQEYKSVLLWATGIGIITFLQLHKFIEKYNIKTTTQLLNRLNAKFVYGLTEENL